MSKEEMQELETGDIVRHKNDIKSFVVMQNCGDYVILARTEHLSNPCEWDVIFKSCGGPSFTEINLEKFID